MCPHFLVGMNLDWGEALDLLVSWTLAYMEAEKDNSQMVREDSHREELQVCIDHLGGPLYTKLHLGISGTECHAKGQNGGMVYSL